MLLSVVVPAFNEEKTIGPLLDELIEVLDHGLGVDKSTADKMFEPFYTERSGGTGLGLYISRELCELNRATLLYLDRPGGGSIFRIVFADLDRWETG